MKASEDASQSQSTSCEIHGRACSISRKLAKGQVRPTADFRSAHAFSPRFMHDQHTMRLPNAFPNQISHLAVHRFFLNIQCRAKAGTRKKNTITTRSSMKNSSTNLPNSFSSVLKRCVAQDAPVFQKRRVAPK